MKKLVYSIIILLIMILPITTKAVATNADDFEPLTVFVFTKNNCQECDKVKDYLDEYIKDKINLKVEYLNSKDQKDTIKKLKDTLSIKQDNYPLIVIGSNYLIGFNDETEKELDKTITEYQKRNVYCNLVTRIQSNEDIDACLTNNKDIIKQVEYKEDNFNIPWFIIGIIVGFISVVVIVTIIRKLKK